MTSIAPPNIGFARWSLEVDYWLQLHGCPQCRERSLGTPRYLEYTSAETGAHMGRYDVTCPKCGHQRSIRFNVLPEYHRPFGTPEHGHLGGSQPSQIISPHLFAEELARCMAELGPNTRADLATLQRLRAYEYEWNPLNNGMTCSIELAKFLPDAQDSIPDKFFASDDARAYRGVHPEQFSRSYIETCRQHFSLMNEAIRAVAKEFDGQRTSSAPVEARPLPLPPFSQAALAFHERWVEHGEGEKNQRMIAVGADARERNLSGRNLSNVLLDKVTLDRANLSSVQLQCAELTEVSAREAQWSNAGLVETKLRRCNFSGSEMTGALLHHSTIEGCDFSGVRLAHASLRKATVTHSTFTAADLTDARLHEAEFADCDLRGVKLGITPDADPQLTDLSFVRCDLRDTDWRGRKLVRVTLIDCKLCGARGVSAFEDAAIDRPDLSPAGNGSLIANEHDAREMLTMQASKDERR